MKRVLLIAVIIGAFITGMLAGVIVHIIFLGVIAIPNPTDALVFLTTLEDLNRRRVVIGPREGNDRPLVSINLKGDTISEIMVMDRKGTMTLMDKDGDGCWDYRDYSVEDGFTYSYGTNVNDGYPDMIMGGTSPVVRIDGAYYSVVRTNGTNYIHRDGAMLPVVAQKWGYFSLYDSEHGAEGDTVPRAP